MTRDVLVWLGLKGARLTETRKNQSICKTLDNAASIVDTKKPGFKDLDELPTPYVSHLNINLKKNRDTR